MTGALILIVEDNDKNRKLVRDVLTFKGYTPSRPKREKPASASPTSEVRAWS